MADVKFSVVSHEIVLDGSSSDGDTEDITLTGFGTPKAAMIFTSFAPTQGTARDDFIFSGGFTDGTNDNAVGSFVEDGLSSTNVGRGQRNDVCVIRLQQGVAGGWIYEYVGSMITDGIRLTLSENSTLIGSGETIRLTVVLIGGADVSAKVGSLNDLNSSSTSITGVGFEPDVVLCFGIGSGTVTGLESFGQYAFGVAAKDGSGGIDQFVAARTTNDGDATSTVACEVRNDCFTGQKGTGGFAWKGSLDSFDADGFTVTTDSNPGSDDLLYFALKLDGANFKAFSSSLPNASTYDENGPGFIPDFGLVTGIPGVSSLNTNTTANTGGLMISAFDDTVVSTQTGFIEDGVGTSNAGGFEDDVLRLLEDDGTDAVVATGAPTFDSGGWTFPITNSAGAARVIWGFAVSDATGAAPTNVAVNQSSETDSAQTITPAPGELSVTANQASESNTAQAITAAVGALTISMGLAASTELAQDITPSVGAVTVSVGQATETDLAQDIDPSSGAVTVSVGQATETDLAQDIDPAPGAVTVSVGQATETDLAQDITASAGLIVSVGQATETSTAQDIDPDFGAVTVSVGLSTETDTARTIAAAAGGETVVETGQPEETDTALDVIAVFDQTVEIAATFEVQQARIITPQLAVEQTVTIGLATDTESAHGIDASTNGLPAVYFIYEEHLDPIKKRGKAVLSRQLAAGERISIERKTPITQELSFSGIADFEQLEYAFDKICFIEQEIEGSLCDCRGEVWPFDPPAEEPEGSVSDEPECQPYDCEAFGDTIAEIYGGDVTAMNLSFDTATTETTLGGTKAVVDGIEAGDGYTVTLNQQSASAGSNDFQISTNPLGLIDPCVEGVYDNGLTIFKGTVASRGELVLSGVLDATWDVVTVIRSRRDSPNNSLSDTGAGNTQCIGKTITVDFDYAGGAFSSSQAFNQTLFVEDDINAKTATFKLQINGQRSGSTTTGSEIVDIGTISLDPDVDAWSNWSLVQFAITEFTLSEAVDWVNASRRRVQLDRTFVIRIGYIGDDGEPQVKEITESYTTYSGAFSGGAISNIAVQTVGSVPVWATKSDVRIPGLYASEAPIDFDDLFLAYRRNLENYTPPDTCSFSGDVI